MKKVLLIIIVILLIVGCSNKKEDNNIPKDIHELITYEVPNKYEHVDSMYWNDNSNIIVQEIYESTKDDGYIQINIFSYKNRYALIEEEREIDEKYYIKRLVKKETLTIDKREFSIGYVGGDDYDKMNAKAYVRNGDYVFEFYISNSDIPITKEQYNDLVSLISTVKFK